MAVNGNQPTSFRYPFALPEDIHPGVRNALRLTYNGVKDLNDAIRKLNTKVNANTTAVTNVTQTVNASSGGGGGTSPVFGFVNLQPNLTPGAYTLAQSDLGGLILVQSAIAFALTLNSGLVTPFFTTVYNLGAGTITATPSLGNVNNGASVTVVTNQFSIFYFDGTNWWDVFSILAQTKTPVAGQFLASYDATTGLFTQAAASTATFHDPEVPSGTINGTTGSDGNPTFTLTATPNPAAQFGLTKNGIVMYQGGAPPAAYSLSGATITYLAPYIPVTGDTHETLAYRTA